MRTLGLRMVTYATGRYSFTIGPGRDNEGLFWDTAPGRSVTDRTRLSTSLTFNHRLDLRISTTLQILKNHLGVALSIHAAEQSWFRREMGFQTLQEVLNFDRAA
jgi:hypothetical protein